MTDMTINQNAESAKKPSFVKKLLNILLIPYKIFEFIIFWGVLLYSGYKLVVKLFFILLLYLHGLK